jgi:DNA-binding GntR family transcriptional regulator
MLLSSDTMLMRDKAYERFVEQLVTGELRPGLFVSQRELVARIGQPLGAVREMVQRLEQEGLLTIVPQRGMQIPHVDLSLVREAFQFRLFLEREAVAVFTGAASDADLARLRREHEAVLAEAERDGPSLDLEARTQAMDWALHDHIIDSLNNSIISTAYRVNSIKMRVIHRERTSIRGRIIPAMQEHMAVIAAMQRRDVPAAVDAISAHIASARELALRP